MKSPACVAETASPSRTVSERRSTENSARAARAPITRASTGLTSVAGGDRHRRAPRPSPPGTGAVLAALDGRRRSGRVVRVPSPAPPRISKLSDSEAISGRPMPRDASRRWLGVGARSHGRGRESRSRLPRRRRRRVTSSGPGSPSSYAWSTTLLQASVTTVFRSAIRALREPERLAQPRDGLPHHHHVLGLRRQDADGGLGLLTAQPLRARSRPPPSASSRSEWTGSSARSPVISSTRPTASAPPRWATAKPSPASSARRRASRITPRIEESTKVAGGEVDHVGSAARRSARSSRRRSSGAVLRSCSPLIESTANPASGRSSAISPSAHNP